MITNSIDKAIHALTKDEVVAIPTETVYGLSANAYSEKAVKKIFDLKKRPLYNPLIVHIKGASSLTEVAQNIPDLAYKLAEIFWPGPLTLLLEKQAHVSDLVTSGKKTVAVRVPDHPRTLELLENLPFPLVAPSANLFGSISPTCTQHVSNYFGNSIDILEGGECRKGIESTIIGFDNEDAIIYRHGSIPVEEIEKITGKLKTITNNDQSPEAPGMLSRHYAPNTDTYLTDDVPGSIRKFEGKRIGLLLFKQPIQHENITYQEVLSASANLDEAAKNFYAFLHHLDSKNLDVIIAERLPESGLGKTINDKLERATKKGNPKI